MSMFFYSNYCYQPASMALAQHQQHQIPKQQRCSQKSNSGGGLGKRSKKPKDCKTQMDAPAGPSAPAIIPEPNSTSTNSNGSEDNLLLGADFASYSGNLKMGQLMNHILKNHIRSYDYQRWENEPDGSSAAASQGEDQRVNLVPDLVPGGPEVMIVPGNGNTATDGPPSKLGKMWRRIKKTFSGRPRSRASHDLENNNTEDLAFDNPVNDNAVVVSPAPAPVPPPRRNSPGRSPFIHCARYTNAVNILQHYVTHSTAVEEPTFSTFSALQEVDHNTKTAAWVSHLESQSTSDLAQNLMESPAPVSLPPALPDFHSTFE